MSLSSPLDAIAGRPPTAPVHAVADGEQSLRAIGALADGGYSVAWWSAGAGLFLQRYAADGSQVGGQAALAFEVEGQDSVLAVLGDGGVLVAYEAIRPAAPFGGVTPLLPTSGIYSRRFDADGVAMGGETQVALSTGYGARSTDHATAPSIVTWPDGGFLVAWSLQRVSYMGTSADFLAQRYDLNGTPVGAVHSLGHGGLGALSFDVSAIADGGVLVGSCTLEQGLRSATFAIQDSASRDGDLDAMHALLGQGTGWAEQTSMLALAGGGYVLWTSRDGVPVTQVFDAAGAPTGVPTPPLAATALALDDGGFVVFRRDAGDQPDWLAQRHDSAGRAVGNEWRIDANGGAIEVAALAGGRLAVAWTSAGPGGDSDVFSQIFDPAVTTPAAAGNDPFAGTVFSEALLGGAGCDLLTGVVGDDVIDGGAGVDTVVYAGALADYDIVRVAQGIGVWGAEGRDLLVAIERLQFADVNVAMDGDGAAGQAYRLYQAAFDRTPDAAGLGFWLRGLDAGLQLAAVAQHFVDSPEFSGRYGAPDSSHFVAQLYANVLHRAPDAAGLAYWQEHLDQGHLGRADTLVHFSESPENQAALAGVIDNGMLYAA